MLRFYAVTADRDITQLYIIIHLYKYGDKPPATTSELEGNITETLKACNASAIDAA